MARKRAFLATCDACLHARSTGESFGLAVAECAMAGLPVITCRKAPPDARHHLDVLGAAALLYDPDVDSATAAIKDFVAHAAAHAARAAEYARLYAPYAPEKVMVELINVFGLSALAPRLPGAEGTEALMVAGRCNFSHIPQL